MSTWIDGVRDRLQAEFGDKPWVCVMATVNEAGEPTARCMVCREIDRDGQLLFVSDRRTRKDDHLRSNPATQVCFWLEKERVQVRVSGRATVLDAVAGSFLRQAWWEQIQAESREIFGAAKGDEDPPMPVTFELITLAPSEVEVQDLKVKANQKQVWRTDGRAWKLAGLM